MDIIINHPESIDDLIDEGIINRDILNEIYHYDVIFVIHLMYVTKNPVTLSRLFHISGLNVFSYEHDSGKDSILMMLVGCDHFIDYYKHLLTIPHANINHLNYVRNNLFSYCLYEENVIYLELLLAMREDVITDNHREHVIEDEYKINLVTRYKNKDPVNDLKLKHDLIPRNAVIYLMAAFFEDGFLNIKDN